MRRWLCRVGATGHQQMPPINVLTGRPDEQHDLNISLSVSALFLEPTGFAREEHEMEAKTHDLVSSCLIMVCSNHRTKPCGMLITFERIWAVRWSFRRLRWSFRCATTTTSWNSGQPAVFLSQSGAHQIATCQKGVKSCQKRVLPKLIRDGGVQPRASIPKRGTCLLYTSPSPRDGLLSRMPSSA